MADPAYGAEHQQRREELLPDAYGKPCPRCKLPMLRGQDLDLGHSTDLALDPNAVGDRIEHTRCNRSDGAELKQRISKYRPTRKWY